MSEGLPAGRSPPAGGRKAWAARAALLALALGGTSLAVCFDLSRSRGLRVAVHPETPIRRGESLAWCAVSQRAWDGASRRFAGSRLDLGPPAPPDAVAALNRHDVDLEDLPPGSFAVSSGVGPPGPAPEERAAFERLLGPGAGRFPDVTDPATAYAFAALSRTLRFEPPFRELDEPLRFSPGPLGFVTGTRVAAFGWEHPSAAADAVSVLWRSDDGAEFALEVRPKEGDDRVVLALLEPGETLAKTWAEVDRRARREAPVPMWKVPHRRRLAVPKVVLERREVFEDFSGARVRNATVPVVVTRFEEWLKFRLDETGVELESTAITVLQVLGDDPPPPVDFEFDRPFLVALRRADSGHPYFLLWVGGPDVLVRR
jgi:hypothetical protein